MLSPYAVIGWPEEVGSDWSNLSSWHWELRISGKERHNEILSLATCKQKKNFLWRKAGLRIRTPHHFNVDSDPGFTWMRIRIQIFTSMRIRIRILLLILRPLQFEPPLSLNGPPRLHCEPLKLLSFDVNAEPDQDFDSNADPVPASQNNADTDRQPCRKVRLTYSTYSPKYIPVLKMDTTVEMKGTPMSSFRNFPKHLTITRKPIFSFLYIAHR
jgi:hypothetical protein